MKLDVNLHRRRFIVSAVAVGGGMVLSVAPAAGKPPAKAAAPIADFSAWIRITPDDTVTVYVPTPEIGNGVMTQCAMTVAEELGCAWSKVRAEFASANRNFLDDDVYGKTNGGPISLGMFAGRSTNEGRMRALLQAGASARERLKMAAAQTWNAPVSEIGAQEGVLTHRPSGRTLRYGMVAGRAASVQLAQEPALKAQEEWTLLGKTAPGKLNNAAIVTGAAIYGIDVRQPNMLYAALRQSPVHGGRLKSYDFEAIRAMPGVHSVVVVDPDEPRGALSFTPPFPPASSPAQSGVAVVAEHYWQARQALEKLPLVWEDGAGAKWKTTEQLHDAAIAACDSPGKVVKQVGDAPGVLAKKGRTVSATYLTPLCEHASIEPLNGTALVTKDRVDLWHPSQHTQQAFAIAVEETGVAPQNVFVHQTYVGGGFGRRIFGDDVRMVVAVAKKVPGRPVHVIWSREETFRQGRYRALEAVKFTARLDAKGMPIALLARTAGIGHSGTGLDDSAYVGGPIPNVRIESKPAPAHIMTGPYRGPSYNSNAFFVESFIDECAAAAGIDPLHYRKTLLATWPDPAWARCLDVAGTESGWGGKLPRGQGRGVAISNWAGRGNPKAGTTVAAVARVEVSKAGELKVQRLDIAFDCGRVINQDAVIAQLQGGTIFGFNMSLNEGLTIENGRIVESNYHEYPMLRLADIPELHIHVTGVSGHDRFSEVGEPGIGPVGPAIANAIFAATGKRVRQTPLRKQDLRWT